MFGFIKSIFTKARGFLNKQDPAEGIIDSNNLESDIEKERQVYSTQGAKNEQEHEYIESEDSKKKHFSDLDSHIYTSLVLSALIDERDNREKIINEKRKK